MTMPTTAANPREHFRELRRSLDSDTQSRHAEQLAQTLVDHPVIANASRIACYLPYDGEIDPSAIIEACWRRQQSVFLPVIAPRENSLDFAAYTPDTPLVPNRFGIDEPDCTVMDRVDAAQMDVILLPVVAFDDEGNRMGMGGGFYDRSLAFTRDLEPGEPPALIGLAHEVQRSEGLVSKNWDIPLGAIATETELRLFD